MNTFFRRRAIFVFIACFVVACAPVLSPTPTPSELPPTVNPATRTPEPSRTPIPPPTRRPSQTPTIGSADDVATFAAEVRTHVAAAPTQAPAIQTRNAPFQACESFFDEERLSPRETWYICGGDGGFTVIHRDGTTSRKFSAQEQFGVEYYGYLSFVHWTADENFLYFAVTNPMDGIGPITTNAEALFRMDLSNGKVSTVLGSINTDPLLNHYVVSISPTSRRLAYSVNMTSFGEVPSQKKLYLVDMQSGEEKVIPIESEYNQIGKFVWSENGQLLIYKLYTDRSGDNRWCSYRYSVRLLDLAADDSITFIKNETIDQCKDPRAEEFEVISVSTNQVILEKGQEHWMYDIGLQRLKIEGAVTPSP